MGNQCGNLIIYMYIYYAYGSNCYTYDHLYTLLKYEIVNGTTY